MLNKFEKQEVKCFFITFCLVLKAFVHYTMRKCNKVIVQKKIFFHDFFSLSEVTTRYKYNRSQYCSVMLLSRHYTFMFFYNVFKHVCICNLLQLWFQIINKRKKNQTISYSYERIHRSFGKNTQLVLSNIVFSCWVQSVPKTIADKNLFKNRNVGLIVETNQLHAPKRIIQVDRDNDHTIIRKSFTMKPRCIAFFSGCYI